MQQSLESFFKQKIQPKAMKLNGINNLRWKMLVQVLRVVFYNQENWHQIVCFCEMYEDFLIWSLILGTLRLYRHVVTRNTRKFLHS